MNKLNLGIVGCGDIADFTAMVSKLIPQVHLSGCCDVNAKRVESFAKRHRIPKSFTDYSNILANADIDAVYLAVPHHLHFEMIVSAVKSGKSVLVEKPITRTIEEGIQLIETMGNHKVGVNYQYRYDCGCYALGRALQKGALGKVHSIRINVPWHRTQKYFEDAAWHKNIAEAGGGTLITQGSHFLDVVLWGLDEKPVSAMGYAKTLLFNVEVDTLTSGIVETSGGTLISIVSSMVAASEQKVTIEAYGEKATAVYSNKPFPRVKFFGAKVPREYPPEWGLHALQRSLSGFAKWVLDDKQYLTPAKATLPVLAAVDAIYRSGKSGKRENVKI